jgi:hypothetical protein
MAAVMVCQQSENAVETCAATICTNTPRLQMFEAHILS